MKDFFEDLGKRLSETAEAVTAKAGDAIEIQKLKAQIRELARGNAEDLMELGQSIYCLLYTSDAADEEDSVDLDSRRNIKKKKKIQKKKIKQMYKKNGKYTATFI